MSTADEDEVPILVEVPEAGPSRTSSLDRPKIPITLLTGYLGAGKSTLLKYILDGDHGYRIAVCMNDFGDTTDIEARSLTLNSANNQTQTTSFLSLPNGCLCCSVKDLGIAAIEEMVAEQEGVDWVIVELTGLADPAPIAKSFWANEEMGDLLLDGVICVVDCRNIISQLQPNSPAQSQLATSDLILLNKTDLVSANSLDRVKKIVSNINPTLKVHETVHSRIELKELFGLGAYTSGSMIRNLSQEYGNGHSGIHAHGEGEGHGHGNGHADDGISTITIPLPRLSSAEYDRLNGFLESLLWEGRLPNLNGKKTMAETETEGEKGTALEVLRTKGLICTEDGKEWVIQGVTDIFEVKEVASEGGMEGKVVFIGKGLEGLGESLKRYVLDA